MPKKEFWNMFFVGCLTVCVYLVISRLEITPEHRSCKTDCSKICDKIKEEDKALVPLWERYIDFNGFNNISGTTDGRYIVPNYVHFIKFGQSSFHFVHAVCVLAAFKNQRPDKIFIHTDQEGFRGKYWDVIINTTGFKEVLIIQNMTVPTQIFGQNVVFKNYHGADIARLEVMMQYGGIFLDRDSYIVRKLDDFRRFEMTLGWPTGKAMGNQILVAHKDARFLQLWYNSYNNNFHNREWYYNAGYYPTEHILEQQPFLVHRVEKLFGVDDIDTKIYYREFPEWRDYYAFHLVIRWLTLKWNNTSRKLRYPELFNEHNLIYFPVAFRDMCEAVYPLNVTSGLVD